MVEYSPRAAKALALLKRHYNDVDIFVEDTANHNMWLLILRKLLPAGLRLDSVNLLGGRGAVEAACRLDQTPNGRAKLYIVDADLDFLLGKTAEELKYFYRIEANNVENLLLNNAALLEMALEHAPAKTPATISKELDFDYEHWLLEFQLRPLFVAYAVTQRLSPSIQTTKYKVSRLFRNTKKGAALDPDKVRRRIVGLYRKLVKDHGIEVVRREREAVAHRSSALPLLKIASGKDYILPLVMLRFKAVCGYPNGTENFKVALARSFNPQIEPELARRVGDISG